MITREVTLRIEATPLELANEFAHMDSASQARFFNALAEITSEWLPMQLQHMIDSPEMTDAGRGVMRQIGEYGIEQKEAHEQKDLES